MIILFIWLKGIATEDVPAHGSMTRAPCLRLVILLWLVAGTAAWNMAGSANPVPPRPAAQSRIDPNTAPWFELTVLPRIGEEMARRIVGYRTFASHDQTGGEKAVAFASPADLQGVRGIGPKTVRRIAPELRFDLGL